ncbi:pentatricopeptide repeat-containing protein At4g21065-like [Amborella trichopoda]|uniref:pentatricopeptide repeat-containing protein At4g21065-like n=1 Tax=Amborella trichopoda TaxID=13333 RepID=UPI0009BDEF6A|nr:pentatricopeptide repeat-containing protein At4g21065-like [Amborella trichopoda]|eukprot:XP_020519799.1 pentatricopeptide repeat-containing protein At4g21065-like [Amborella trichopoda]
MIQNASIGEWGGAVNVRRLMGDRGVKKEPDVAPSKWIVSSFISCLIQNRLKLRTLQGSMDNSLLVFQQMKHPYGFIWNTMIRGFGRFGNSFETFRFYQKMRQKGKAIDNFTMSFLLKICAQDSVLELGKQAHCTSTKHGLDSHVFVPNTLIHMYAMRRDIESANQLFKYMPIHDLVSWNTIIDRYVQCGQSKEALRMFIRMQRIGMEPDEATIVTILSACANIGALDFGRWVHSYSQETGLDSVVSVCNTLIDMYGKC